MTWESLRNKRIFQLSVGKRKNNSFENFILYVHFVYVCKTLSWFTVNNSFEKIVIYPIQNIVKDSLDSILKVH